MALNYILQKTVFQSMILASANPIKIKIKNQYHFDLKKSNCKKAKATHSVIVKTPASAKPTKTPGVVSPPDPPEIPYSMDKKHITTLKIAM